MGGHKQGKAEAHISERKHFLKARGENKDTDFPGEKEESYTKCRLDVV